MEHGFRNSIGKNFYHHPYMDIGQRAYFRHEPRVHFSRKYNYLSYAWDRYTSATQIKIKLENCSGKYYVKAKDFSPDASFWMVTR